MLKLKMCAVFIYIKTISAKTLLEHYKLYIYDSKFLVKHSFMDLYLWLWLLFLWESKPDFLAVPI